ncbi:MAG: flagellar motor switch protein FliM [Armatimonadetes bacterium]|nr:flagellar motor switch protein FliM [Armatimonadota bacterium]
MSKVLSQNEIDMLVSALSSGEIKKGPPPAVAAQAAVGAKEEKVVRLYDFKQPEKLSKLHMRNLNTVYEDFTRLSSNAMAVYLRTHVEISHAKTDQLPYGDLIYGEPDRGTEKPKQAIISLFRLLPLHGSGILQLDLPLIYCMIDRLLGGPGWGKQKVRPLTELERQLTTEMFHKILTNFRDAWAKIMDLTPKVEVLEQDPRLIPRAVPFHEVMVRCVMGMKVGENFGLMKLAIPYSSLYPMLVRLTEQLEGAAREPKDEQNPQSLKQRMGNIRLPMTVELGAAALSVQEFLDLQAGNVVLLESKTDDDLKVKVNGKTKFLGRPGLVSDRKAVQIVKVLGELQEEGETDD